MTGGGGPAARRWGGGSRRKILWKKSLISPQCRLEGPESYCVGRILLPPLSSWVSLSKSLSFLYFSFLICKTGMKFTELPWAPSELVDEAPAWEKCSETRLCAGCVLLEALTTKAIPCYTPICLALLQALWGWLTHPEAFHTYLWNKWMNGQTNFRCFSFKNY